jgi:hypothetical protein
MAWISHRSVNHGMAMMFDQGADCFIVDHVILVVSSAVLAVSSSNELFSR